MQTKKIADVQQPQVRGQFINIPKNKYMDMEKKFQKDPASFISAQRNSGGAPGGSGGNRLGMDPKQMQEMQKRMEAEIKSRNNPIELK